MKYLPLRILACCFALAVVAAALAATSGLSAATRAYLVIWKETEPLHRHMVALAPQAAEAHYSLGVVLLDRSEIGEKRFDRKLLEEALRELPNFLHPDVPEGDEDAFRVLRTHGEKIYKQQSGWGYSLIALGCFLLMLTVGLGKIGVSPAFNQGSWTGLMQNGESVSLVQLNKSAATYELSVTIRRAEANSSWICRSRAPAGPRSISTRRAGPFSRPILTPTSRKRTRTTVGWPR